MKYTVLCLLVICAVIFAGCGKKDETATTGPTGTGAMPSSTMPGAGGPSGPGTMPTGGTTPMGATPTGSTMPSSGGMAGPGMSGSTMPTGSTMPSAGGMSPSMGGMPGAGGMATPGMAGTSGMTGGAVASTTPAPSAEIKEEYPKAKITRDKTGEMRNFYNPEALKKDKSKLNELQSREVALAFIRENYYYFDTMSFEYRKQPGVFSGGTYNYKWIQIIRETKKTGNTIDVSVNPYSGMVVSYKSTRKNWTN